LAASPPHSSTGQSRLDSTGQPPLNTPPVSQHTLFWPLSPIFKHAGLRPRQGATARAEQNAPGPTSVPARVAEISAAKHTPSPTPLACLRPNAALCRPAIFFPPYSPRSTPRGRIIPPLFHFSSPSVSSMSQGPSLRPTSSPNFSTTTAPIA